MLQDFPQNFPKNTQKPYWFLPLKVYNTIGHNNSSETPAVVWICHQQGSRLCPPTGESDGSSPSIIDGEWSLCIEKNGRHKNTCRRKKEKRCIQATPLETSKEAGDHKKFITMPLCCAMPCAKKSYGKKHACTCNTHISNKDPDKVNSSMVMSPGITTYLEAASN